MPMMTTMFFHDIHKGWEIIKVIVQPQDDDPHCFFSEGLKPPARKVWWIFLKCSLLVLVGTCLFLIFVAKYPDYPYLFLFGVCMFKGRGKTPNISWLELALIVVFGESTWQHFLISLATMDIGGIFLDFWIVFFFLLFPLTLYDTLKIYCNICA